MDAQEPDITQNPAATGLSCPACGVPAFAGDEFCEACGQRLSEPPPAAADTPANCTVCGAAAIDADGYCGQCGLRQPTGRDHVEVELLPGGAAGVSDKGLRHSKNEDAMALASSPALPGIVAVVVSDGVSTSPRPEDASRVAADTGVAVLLKELESGTAPEPASRRALDQAASAVAALAGSEHDAPACTYVSALTTPGSVTVSWVGDSRAYWVDADGQGGARLTEDDSWAGQMVALGALSEAEAQAHRNAHVLVGWLGADAGPTERRARTFAPGRAGAVIVCTDGLWNYLPDAEAIAALLPGSDSPVGAARRLVQTALQAGGHDNVTVVVIPFFPAEV